LGVALVVSAYLVAWRTSVPELPKSAEPRDSPVIQNTSAIAETAPLPNGAVGTEPAVAELRAMSPTFRNSTFLIAIRRAGYYCDEVVSATESAEGGWVASCANKGGYTLSAHATDEFDVRPIGHYLDAIAPGLIPRVLIPRDLEQR
jgi:hypothetical protein